MDQVIEGRNELKYKSISIFYVLYSIIICGFLFLPIIRFTKDVEIQTSAGCIPSEELYYKSIFTNLSDSLFWLFVLELVVLGIILLYNIVLLILSRKRRINYWILFMLFIVSVAIFIALFILASQSMLVTTSK